MVSVYRRSGILGETPAPECGPKFYVKLLNKKGIHMPRPPKGAQNDFLAKVSRLRE